MLDRIDEAEEEQYLLAEEEEEKKHKKRKRKKKRCKSSPRTSTSDEVQVTLKKYIRRTLGFFREINFTKKKICMYSDFPNDETKNKFIF